ncbi:DUF695 domain-containing protein [Wenyingzhuangia sp. IMCC45574]
MKFFKNLFSAKKETTLPVITNDADFWKWFESNESTFFKVIDTQNNVAVNFLDKILPQLKTLDENYWVLCGMYSDEVAELIITVDGEIKDFYKVEELIEKSPQLKNWKFTAHKPGNDIKNCEINMYDFIFSKETLSFCVEESKKYPDEIDLVITHKEITEGNYESIGNGIYIFLENYLGELKFAETIDNVSIRERKENEDFIPIDKLKDYLLWREKEFIEKYDGIRVNTEDDTYSSFEWKAGDAELPLFAVMNTDLLHWDAKASHQWFVKIVIEYNGEENNGLPTKKDYELLDEIENEINKKLVDKDGHLNIGRETGANQRVIYVANTEYRHVSKVMHDIKYIYESYFTIDFSIYKDKYWMTLKSFE